MRSLSRLSLGALLPLLFAALAGAAPPVRAQDPSQDPRWADPAVQASALTLARRAFDAYALRREVIDQPAHLPAVLRQPMAVFVSTMRAGAPRCCMGSLYPTQPDAAQEIIASAVAAAGHDRRFPPIRPGELAHLTLIVSLVSRPRPITEAEAASLDPVRDGLAVRNGDRWGVVLSGESPRRENMMPWGRIRAGADPHTPVQWFQISDLRLRETPRR